MHFSVIFLTFVVFCKATSALVSRARASVYLGGSCIGASREGFTQDQLQGEWVWKVGTTEYTNCINGVTLNEGLSDAGQSNFFVHKFARRHIPRFGFCNHLHPTAADEWKYCWQRFSGEKLQWYVASKSDVLKAVVDAGIIKRNPPMKAGLG